VLRKRPGTLGICAVIQHKYHIEGIPHILCRGFTKEETEDLLFNLKYLGIQNVFAVQGDSRAYQNPHHPGCSVNDYACDLVKQIANFRKGGYLDHTNEKMEPVNFCVGVAGYPEKHYEAPNLMSDLMQTKAKIDAGADYLVTQMFFDNRHYYAYVKNCRKMGITVPIIPGLKILTKQKQLQQLPKNFFIDIPWTLSEKILHAKGDQIIETGIRHALQQVTDLFAHGVPGIHFFVTDEINAIEKLLERVPISLNAPLL